ncbi:hypothetical protein ACLB2K_001945 [Fragaria x ananassa]
MSSEANSEKPPRNPSETKNDISTVEDPFRAITYNTPQKPVLTFVAGASCIVIGTLTGILIGFGIASLLAYYVFMNWRTFEQNGYLQDQQNFNMALIQRIQDDAKVRERIGSPYYRIWSRK